MIVCLVILVIHTFVISASVLIAYLPHLSTIVRH